MKLQKFATNLLTTTDVLKSFKKLTKKDVEKLYTALGTLNAHGLDPDIFGDRIEQLKGKPKYRKIYEYKVKSLSKREWRFLVIPSKLESGEECYVILHSFLKQSENIKENDKEKAYSVAKQAGLL